MMSLIGAKAGQLGDGVGVIKANTKAIRDMQCHATCVARRRFPTGEKIELYRVVAISRVNC